MVRAQSTVVDRGAGIAQGVNKMLLAFVFWGFFFILLLFGVFSFCFCLLVWEVGVVFCFKLTFGGGYKDGGRYGGTRK